MSQTWQGIFPAVTTPFLPDMRLDIDAFRTQLKWQIDAGVHGIIVSGSLGEASTLTDQEKISLVKIAKETIPSHIPVLMCISSSSTQHACHLAAQAADNGADGLMALPPLNYRSDTDETIAYFQAIASAGDIPIMIYNNPVSYGVDVKPAHFATLAEEPLFVAIKESSDDIRRITHIHNIVGDRYAVFSGVDNLGMESLLMGAHGWVAGLVCAYPRETVAIYNLVKNGHLSQAREIYRWFIPLLDLDVSSKLVQNIKLAQTFVGMGSETVRPPRLTLKGSEREEVLKVLQQAQAQHHTIAPLLEMDAAKEINRESQFC